MWERGRLKGEFVAVRYVDGKRQRRRLGTTDPNEAAGFIHELNATPARNVRVGRLWDAYVAENKGKAVTETMRYTRKALAPIMSVLHHQITHEMCLEHIEARRANGIQDGTIHTELGHLGMVLNWGVKRGIIAKAPHVSRPPKPEAKTHWLTREQVHAVIDAAGLPHVRLYLILMITTSARVGALLELTWSRVDIPGGRIHLANPDDPVRRKSRATVPINRTAMAALTEARSGALTRHVIEWNGRPVKSVKKSLRGAYRRAGIDASGAHIFRHSAAVWMAEAGVDIRKIAEYLGHRDTKATERIYARFRPDHLADAAEVLELNMMRRR